VRERSGEESRYAAGAAAAARVAAGLVASASPPKEVVLMWVVGRWSADMERFTPAASDEAACWRRVAPMTNDPDVSRDVRSIVPKY
jgi:hypothetical protein